MVQIFPQIWEGQQTRSTWNIWKKYTNTHIIILLESKDKKKILKKKGKKRKSYTARWGKRHVPWNKDKNDSRFLFGNNAS
jgi:hypothetical protein